MATQILKAQSGGQLFDVLSKAIQGETARALGVALYDAAGNPILTQANKGQVRASEIEALIGAVDAAAETDPTQAASQIALLKGILTRLADGEQQVKINGSTVTIGGSTFQVSEGDTLRGKAADKPTAADAHAAIPFCYFFSVDAGTLEVTDGTNWVVM